MSTQKLKQIQILKCCVILNGIVAFKRLHISNPKCSKGAYMLKFIGEIKTPYTTIEQCPRNISKDGPACTLAVYSEYQKGLKGLSAGEKILILYWLDMSEDSPMEQTSLDDGTTRGVFSLRSPHRPNPIGAAIVKIENMTENTIEVKGLDCLSGTKLLDIKPAIMDEA